MSVNTFVSDILRDMLVQSYINDYYARIRWYESRAISPTREDRINASKEAWKEANRHAEIFQVAHADMLKELDPTFSVPDGALTEDEKKQREKIEEELGLKSPKTRSEYGSSKTTNES